MYGQPPTHRVKLKIRNPDQPRQGPFEKVFKVKTDYRKNAKIRAEEIAKHLGFEVIDFVEFVDA